MPEIQIKRGMVFMPDTGWERCKRRWWGRRTLTVIRVPRGERYAICLSAWERIMKPRTVTVRLDALRRLAAKAVRNA